MKTIEKESCPHCGQSINPREIVLTKPMVKALRDVFAWCEREGRWLGVRRSEFKHIFRDETKSANFANWKAFAPHLVGVKSNKGYYNFDRAGLRDFLAGQTTVASKILRDPLTGTDTLEDFRTVGEMPGCKLTANEEFVVRYHGATAA